MPVERYFIAQPLHLHDQIILKEIEFHHLAHVMRTRVEEEVELINGQGALAIAIVNEIRKDQAKLTIQKLTFEHPQDKQVILAQAIPKPNRLDTILEKGTELGVDEFWLFPGELSVKKDFSDHQVERLEAQIISAMKQCGRLFLPKLLIKPRLKQWQSFPQPAFFGDLESKAPLFFRAWKHRHCPKSFSFFIGPESGFSKSEIDILLAQHAQGVALHPNILRTDTAAITALSLVEHWLMEL